MKIAISAQEKSLKAQVDPRFGRASGFIVYDLDTDKFDYIDNNQNLNIAQGAGIQTAQNVAAAKVGAIITGHVGPKAFLALQKGGIKMYFAKDQTVGEAVESFRKGDLELAEGADKPGHW